MAKSRLRIRTPPPPSNTFLNTNDYVYVFSFVFYDVFAFSYSFFPLTVAHLYYVCKLGIFSLFVFFLPTMYLYNSYEIYDNNL